MVEKLLEIIKLSPKYFIGITIATGFLIFDQRGIISSLGLVGFIDEYRGWIGIIFLVSVSITIVNFSEPIFRKVKVQVSISQIKKLGKKS